MLRGPSTTAIFFLRVANEMQQSNGNLDLIGSHVSILHLTNRPNRSNRRKVMGPFYNKDFFSLITCSSPMESWTFESNLNNFHQTNRLNRSNRRQVVGPFYNGDISQMKCSTPMESWTFKSHTQFHHLTNRTKRSNVYDPFSNGLYLTVLENEIGRAHV